MTPTQSQPQSQTTNSRRRAVTSDPHANAEGLVPLSFRGFELHRLNEQDFTSKRNGLPITKFTILNPANGDTVAVLSQCAVRRQVLDAFDRAEAGDRVKVRSVYGARVRRDFRTGMTTIAAKTIQFDFQPAAPSHRSSVQAIDTASSRPPQPESMVPDELLAAASVPDWATQGSDEVLL